MSTAKVSLGKQAPAFSAAAAFPDGSIKNVSLDDYKGKYLLFFWYPLDWTFVCPTEIIDFSTRADEFRAIGCEVLGASTDSPFSHLAWMEAPRKAGGLGGLNIPLLSDLKQSIARDYGCLMEDDGHACRATYLIDDKGVVRHFTFNHPDAGRNVDEMLRLVQAYQHAAAHGVVCPSGWKPGKSTIKPNPKDSKEFFSQSE